MGALLTRFKERRAYYTGLGIVALLVITAVIVLANLSPARDVSEFSRLWRRAEAVHLKQAVDLSAQAELAELEGQLATLEGTDEEGLALWFLAIYQYREAYTPDKASFEDRKPHLEKATEYIDRLADDPRFDKLLISRANWYLDSSLSPVDQLRNQIAADLKYERDNATKQVAPDTDLTAVLRTSAGDIYLHFYKDLAPEHVKNFITLAKAGTYNGTAFHFIEGGSSDPVSVLAGDPYSYFYNDPLNETHIRRWGRGGVGYDIPPEEARFRVNHRRGIVTSLKRGERADWDNGSQFQIMLQPNQALDRRLTPFAQVVEGMDVVEKAAKRKTAAEHGEYKDKPAFGGRDTRDLVVEPVWIHKVLIFENGAAADHAFPLSDLEKSLDTLKNEPVQPLSEKELAAGRELLPVDAKNVARGRSVPFPEDIDIEKASPKGDRKTGP